VVSYECYCLTGGLDWNVTQHVLKIFAFLLNAGLLWSRMHHASGGRITTFGCCNFIPHQCWTASALWTRSCLL